MTRVIDALMRGVQILSAFSQPLATAGAIFTGLVAVYAHVAGWIDTLVVRLDTFLAVVGSLGGGPADFRPLSFVNFVFPFTEFLALLGGYLTLLSVAAIVRIIKSFIPTVA